MESEVLSVLRRAHTLCGIAGFAFSSDLAPETQLQTVQRMVDRMRSRGPDAEGIWYSKCVVLGHRRLAILDLDARSNQPMISADGRYSLVFNGEIYNFHLLRSELEAQGEVFRTTSDTEVLIALYSRYREQMLPRLRGMFAFAIWDKMRRELFLARDPYGIKPLYYFATRQGMLFASQVKALLSSGLVAREIEPAGLAGFYIWGNVPEPWTLYKGLLALPAGTWMKVISGIPQAPVSWRDISESWSHEQRGSSAAELQQEVRRSVRDSVQAHLVSDVPVSVFLSGGIDSGAIAGLASQSGTKTTGITVGFKEFAERHDDEVPVASQLASHYGIDHHVRIVTRSEFEDDIPRIMEAMDQPTIDGVNTWFASKAAAECGFKVVLSGVGGDELLYGYNLVHEIPRSAQRNRAIAAVPGARWLLKRVVDRVPSGTFHPKLRGIPDYMGSIEGEYLLRRSLFLPEELPGLMGAEAAREGLQRLGRLMPATDRTEALAKSGVVAMLDSTLYLRNQLLRDSDWTSMAHSLELRTPLVDVALLDALKPFQTRFKGGAGKRMLANSPVPPLPDAIIGRTKSGFSLPMTRWLPSGSHDAKTPWTRRWAISVIDSVLASDWPRDGHNFGDGQRYALGA